MPPMGDASSVDPNMGAGQMAGADPMMGGDPSMGAEAPMPDGGDMGGEEGSGDDSTMSLFDQLSDEDKEAARSYIESMLDKSDGNSENQETPDMNAPQENEMGQMPMESFIFTKKQLKKINEEIGVNLDSERNDNNLNKRTNKTSKRLKNSPFSSPKFN